MIRRRDRRRARRPSLAPRLVPLGSAFVLALVVALLANPTRAQTFRSTIDSIAYYDSVASAETLRVMDSIAVADSIAAAQENAGFAEAQGTFGGARTIIDRPHPGGPLLYSTNYGINRSNRNWSQTADFKMSPGNWEIANLTSVSIGRENSVGRINRNSNTRTELAYRVSPWLRLGGGLGIGRLSDQAKTNFSSVQQDNDDASAQALFNTHVGVYPLRGSVSYGYLKNEQREQSSSGRSTNLFASTSRTWANGSSVVLDAAQLLSHLTSTVPDDSSYLQDDRNSNTSLRLVSSFRPRPWATFDLTGTGEKSRIERPARLQPDLTEDVFIVVPETVNGRNGTADGTLRLQLPRASSMTIRGSRSLNEQIYSAEEDRTAIANRTSFQIDANPPPKYAALSLTYENTTNDNDYTRRDPGYIESSLLRRLEGSASKALTGRTSARANAGISLTRRRYGSYTSITGVPAPSDQDQLRTRGSLNVTYRPSTRFDTGLTLGAEENDVVNLASNTSINNARQRSYSVTWLWNAKPGDIWAVTQTNNATAVQQYYDFTPDRDQLSFIYNLTTNITTQLTKAVRFDVLHTARIQSRGSWRFVEDSRRFGKANEFNSFDLNLRAAYAPKSWLTLEAQERLTSSPNYTFARGVGTKTTESRRTEFTVLARTNYAFSSTASLSGDVRRILSTDRSRTFGAFPSDRSVDNDYWFGTISFRMELL
jgi:hypothetical protein